MKRIWAASHERGLRLKKAGCEIPYLDELPRKKRFHGLEVGPIGGYIESLAIENGATTHYVIALRLSTDRSTGSTVSTYSFIPPWLDHEIFWEYDAEQLLPASWLKRYESLLNSRLSAVLNQRALLYRGRPLEGLMAGSSWASIPPSVPRNRSADARITLVDDSSKHVRSVIPLTIIQSDYYRSQISGRKTRAVLDLDGT